MQIIGDLKQDPFASHLVYHDLSGKFKGVQSIWKRGGFNREIIGDTFYRDVLIKTLPTGSRVLGSVISCRLKFLT
jgi:hypothetical protein